MRVTSQSPLWICEASLARLRGTVCKGRVLVEERTSRRSAQGHRQHHVRIAPAPAFEFSDKLSHTFILCKSVRSARRASPVEECSSQGQVLKHFTPHKQDEGGCEGHLATLHALLQQCEPACMLLVSLIICGKVLGPMRHACGWSVAGSKDSTRAQQAVCAAAAATPTSKAANESSMDIYCQSGSSAARGCRSQQSAAAFGSERTSAQQAYSSKGEQFDSSNTCQQGRLEGAALPSCLGQTRVPLGCPRADSAHP